MYALAHKLMLRHSITSAIDLGSGPEVKPRELLSPVAKKISWVDQRTTVGHCKGHYPEGKFYSENLEVIDQSGPRDHFDLIICSDPIEHLKDAYGLVQYVRNIAHSGSFVVISTSEKDVIRG
jgi:2-polyprenyl-3-methyl-5-hydroxy-6-metoxy-1,4-benzoquinol methylase